MNMKKNIPALLILALSLLHVRSENVLSDSFSYANGPIVGAFGSPWINNSGTTPMLATNSSLEVSFSRAEDIAAPLSRIISTNAFDTAAYASFSVRFLALPSTGGTYFAHFTAATIGSAYRARIWATITNAALGKFRFSIANNSLGSANSALWPSDLDTNVTYKVVTRYDLVSGLSKLWINPTVETDPSVTGTDAVVSADIVYFGFRQSSGEGVSRVDDLRVGTTFNDVAGPNAPPTISIISAINVPVNGSAGPIAFAIADSETPANALVLSRTSSNPALLPTNNIVFGGSGTTRTFTITPLPGQEGVSTVGIIVTDGDGATASRTFTVTVGAPSISNIGNQVTPTNVTLTDVAFTVTDAETPNSLTVTATSTNTALISPANIVVNGTGASRTLTITPTAGQAGLTLITVTVSDGTQTASDTFVVTVFPLLGVLINEPFTYADGTHLADGSTAWIHHSGANFGETLVNAGAVSITQTNDEDFNREFAPTLLPPESGVILYASFKVNFSALPTSSGSYFAHYKDTGALNFRGRVFSSSQGAAAGKFRLGVANTANSISTNGLHPTFLDTNVTYAVVSRYNVGTDETTLWINPASEASPSVTATDAATPIMVDSFALRQSGGIGVFSLDDLKIGTAFTDVSVVAANYSLIVARTGSDVVVSWPTAASGFTLQSCDSLTTTNWQNVAGSPVVVDSNNYVTNSALSGHAFFRLKN